MAWERLESSLACVAAVARAACPRCRQRQHLHRRAHHDLAQPFHIHAALDRLTDGEVGTLRPEQVADVLIPSL